jgi:hypothetical protein
MITRTLPANPGKDTTSHLSFLILIGHFATLEGMKIKSVTPMHHLMIMGSSAAPAGDGLAGGSCRHPEQGL